MPPKPAIRPRSAPGANARLTAPSQTVATTLLGLLTISLGVSLAWLFWWPLWHGGGLIGGDLYFYFFPQKVFLAESLTQGIIPLWNPLVGFGYPVLGESQTGALYPPNLLLNSFWNVNAAYNLSQLGHYVVTFIAAFALARRLGLHVAGGLLCSLTFTYGWFPARICLEWAIIGGAGFILILWAVTAFLQTQKSRYLTLVAVFLGLDLLAGHYNLAFITLLVLLPLPWLVVSRESDGATHSSERTNVPPRRSRGVALAGLSLAIVCGFLLASVQLLPTWELKSLSQRQRVSDVFAPTYGHLPPAAISQLWMPWAWYNGKQSTDELLQGSKWLAVPSSTNQVEAQLYLGMLPLILAMLGLLLPALRSRSTLIHAWGWGAMVLVSLLFATGWPTYWLSNFPGFGFFRGPGRYSIVAALALALLAGAGLDAVFRWQNWNRIASGCVFLMILSITVGDLWAASRKFDPGPPEYFGRSVFYATLLDHPPLERLNQSPLRKFFQSAGGNARLFAPGQNVPTMLGINALPVYLGLGPEIYESNDLRVDFGVTAAEQVSQAAQRLRNLGVTHLLLERELDPKIWPVKPLGPIVDPFFNSALARPEPFYFYELTDSRGRAFFAAGDEQNRVLSVNSAPHHVRIEVEHHGPGELVLRDLFYPGWSLVDPTLKSERFENTFRSVQLSNPSETHGRRTIEWQYRPVSFGWGLALTLLGLVATPCLLCWPQPRSRK